MISIRLKLVNLNKAICVHELAKKWQIQIPQRRNYLLNKPSKISFHVINTEIISLQNKPKVGEEI